MTSFIRALFTCAWIFAAIGGAVWAADDVLLSRGERVQADVSGGGGSWKIGTTAVKAGEVLVIRFSPEPPPTNLAAGIFIRGGSLIAGSLTSLIGDSAEISSNALGMLPLKRDDVAGMYTALPAGQAENIPELARYSSLLNIAFDSGSNSLQPGKVTRVRQASGDEFQAEEVKKIGLEQIIFKTRDKGIEPIARQNVRLLEMTVPPMPVPTADEERLGPEVILRLKGGDLIRGRVVKLNEQGLTLRTTFMGEKLFERQMLAALFIAGGPGSGVVWLSSVKPSKVVETPMFDAKFPPRMDASVDRACINIGGLHCERGIGMHSKCETEFPLSAVSQRFICVYGIDNETRGRGQAVARVLTDGKEAWKSETVSGSDSAKIVALDIGNARSITLEVDYGPDNDDSGDHFDWGWAAVISK
jgi:hypothetical protein